MKLWSMSLGKKVENNVLRNKMFRLAMVAGLLKHGVGLRQLSAWRPARPAVCESLLVIRAGSKQNYPCLNVKMFELLRLTPGRWQRREHDGIC